MNWYITIAKSKDGIDLSPADFTIRLSEGVDSYRLTSESDSARKYTCTFDYQHVHATAHVTLYPRFRRVRLQVANREGQFETRAELPSENLAKRLGLDPIVGASSVSHASDSKNALLQAALRLSRDPQSLPEAAELLEKALAVDPDLRAEYEPRLKNWRRGISM